MTASVVRSTPGPPYLGNPIVAALAGWRPPAAVRKFHRAMATKGQVMAGRPAMVATSPTSSTSPTAPTTASRVELAEGQTEAEPELDSGRNGCRRMDQIKSGFLF